MRPRRRDITARDQAVSPFYWTVEEFCAGELLPFVFASAEDERAQYTMLIGQVAAVRIQGVDPANDTIIRGFGDLVTLLEAELGDDATRSKRVAGSAVTGSINAMLRRREIRAARGVWMPAALAPDGGAR